MDAEEEAGADAPEAQRQPPPVPSLSAEPTVEAAVAKCARFFKTLMHLSNASHHSQAIAAAVRQLVRVSCCVVVFRVSYSDNDLPEINETVRMRMFRTPFSDHWILRTSRRDCSSPSVHKHNHTWFRSCGCRCLLSVKRSLLARRPSKALEPPKNTSKNGLLLGCRRLPINSHQLTLRSHPGDDERTVSVICGSSQA